MVWGKTPQNTVVQRKWTSFYSCGNTAGGPGPTWQLLVLDKPGHLFCCSVSSWRVQDSPHPNICLCAEPATCEGQQKPCHPCSRGLGPHEAPGQLSAPGMLGEAVQA